MVCVYIILLNIINVRKGVMIWHSVRAGSAGTSGRVGRIDRRRVRDVNGMTGTNERKRNED
jgi:hypothetical protein